MKFPKKTTAADAVKAVESGHRVFVHGGAAVPTALLSALVERAGQIENVHLYHMHVEGKMPLASKVFEGIFLDNSFFVGENVRQAVSKGLADYIPVSLGDLPFLFRKKIIPLDVALVSVSPPDKHGFVSLGTSVDVALAAVQSAKTVIAQINKAMPRTQGDGVLHLRDFDFTVESEELLPVKLFPEPSPEEILVANHVAALIPDGATLQMGIGTLPNAVLANLFSHKDLGVHTEMFSDGLLPLINTGAVNNSRKKVLPGRTVTSFLIGSRRLYDFVDDNPAMVVKDISWVNDPEVIARNPNVVAINSAIEVDLTGQVCADSIGVQLYSGVGGQMDFILGAAQSSGGIPIIAMCSRTAHGAAKIAPTLREGAGVTVTRSQAHWIVTEYGAVNLFGKNLRERAKLLISIAHPEDRETLERSVWEKRHVLA